MRPSPSGRKTQYVSFESCIPHPSCAWLAQKQLGITGEIWSGPDMLFMHPRSFCILRLNPY